MTDKIQRYTMSGIMTPVKQDEVTTTKWVKEPDYLKAMEAKDETIQYIKEDMAYLVEKHEFQSVMLSEQAKEIERLNQKIELLEACREYDASGINYPDGYIFTNYEVSQRQQGES